MLEKNVESADEEFRHKIKKANTQESAVDGAPALPDLFVDAKK
jgi:hypothetical protein